MTVVSIDLAYKRYVDIGVCVLEQHGSRIACEFVCLDGGGILPSPADVADQCIGLCRDRRARVMLVDGPQAWKSPTNGLLHSRACERALNTPAKTGLPGVVKPAPYTSWASFSVAFFDALAQRGWPRFAGRIGCDEQVAIESFPSAAWRKLGMPSLPAKSRCTGATVSEHYERLAQALAITASTQPSHDQLQALVGGLAGLALERGTHHQYTLFGEPPHCLEGAWREGYIICPAPAFLIREHAAYSPDVE